LRLTEGSGLPLRGLSHMLLVSAFFMAEPSIETAEDEAARFAFVRKLMDEHIPFNRVLGLRVRHIARGTAVLEIPFRPELIGDSDRPALHGGVVSALADTCGGAAAWTQVGAQDRVSTIDLRVDYLRPGRAETVVATGHVLRVGNRVAVVNVVVTHDGDAEPIAEAKGVYAIKRVGGNR
jgi:uncharacterized protein (TIGR00369 family)